MIHMSILLLIHILSVCWVRPCVPMINDSAEVVSVLVIDCSWDKKIKGQKLKKNGNVQIIMQRPIDILGSIYNTSQASEGQICGPMGLHDLI